VGAFFVGKVKQLTTGEFMAKSINLYCYDDHGSDGRDQRYVVATPEGRQQFEREFMQRNKEPFGPPLLVDDELISPAVRRWMDARSNFPKTREYNLL
jgi:hypothetical protein